MFYRQKHDNNLYAAVCANENILQQLHCAFYLLKVKPNLWILHVSVKKRYFPMCYDVTNIRYHCRLYWKSRINILPSYQISGDNDIIVLGLTWQSQTYFHCTKDHSYLKHSMLAQFFSIKRVTSNKNLSVLYCNSLKHTWVCLDSNPQKGALVSVLYCILFICPS